MAENTHNTKIVISGDASGATGALNGVKDLLSKGVVGALHGVRSAINRVMQAFGLFGLAMQGVQYLIDGYRKLNEWMNRAAKAAAELRIAAIFKDAADSMNRLISRQETYNKLLKEELADLGRRKQLQGIAQSGKEQREVEKREIARAKEIAGAANEDEERAIRQRWAEEDELRERGKRYRELKGNVAEEAEKSAIYGSKAGAAESNVKSADAAIAVIRANSVRMNEEQLKEAKKQIEALEAKRKANAEAAAEFRKEEELAERRAELYRQQIKDVQSGGGVARAKAEAENAKIARERAEKDFEEKKKKARESSDAAAEFVREHEESQRKERESRISVAEGVAERVASFDGVSQNRLTAMGLGSGVSASGGVASDVKKLVDLLKQQVDESKKLNEKDYSSGPATYAE